MTESDYTRKLIKSLRQRLHKPGEITFKHADMFTMGVPDFSVTRGGLTSWFEAKKLETNLQLTTQGNFLIVRPRYDVPAVQWETLRRLIRGFLVIYTAHGHGLVKVAGSRESVAQLLLTPISLEKLVLAVIEAAEHGGQEVV